VNKLIRSGERSMSGIPSTAFPDATVTSAFVPQSMPVGGFAAVFLCFRERQQLNLALHFHAFFMLFWQESWAEENRLALASARTGVCCLGPSCSVRLHFRGARWPSL
jgi:hypothetical protein